MKQKRKGIVYMLFWLSILTTNVFAEIQGSIQNDPRTVNVKTKLVFEINQWKGGQTLKAGSFFDIIFPQGDMDQYWNSFKTEETDLQNSDCYTSFGFNAQETLNCRATKSSRTIRVKLNQDSVWAYVGFVIGNVINQDSARKSSPFSIYLYENSSTLTDQSLGNSKMVVKSESDALAKVVMSNSNDTVGEYGQLTVTVTPTHDIAVQGDVVITFPKWDSNSEETVKRQGYMKDNKCSIIKMPSSNIQTTATCEVQTGLAKDTVTIRGALTSSMKGGKAFSFTISSVRNSPSLKGINTVSVYTQKYDKTEVEKMENIEYKPLKMASIPAIYFQPQFANNQVSTMTELFFRIKFLMPVPANSVITITFPPEVRITDPSGQQSYLNSVKQGVTFLKHQVLTSSGTAKDTVQITDAFSSYLEPLSTIYLQFSKVQTPVSSAITQSFKVRVDEVHNGKFYAIEGASEGITLQTAAQQLPNIEFRSSNQTVFMPFDGTFSTRYNGILKTQDSIEIEYPQSFKILDKYQSQKDTTISCQAIIANKVYSPVCKLNSITRTVTFTQISLIQLDFTASESGMLFQMTVKDVFVNPDSEEPIKIQANVNIKDRNSNIIAFYNYTQSKQKLTYKAVPMEVNQFRVQSDNPETGGIGKFTFSLDILKGQKLDKGFVLDIMLPAQVGLITSKPISCQAVDLLVQAPKCQSSSLPNQQPAIQVNFVDQLRSLEGPQKFSFVVDSMRNPFTTKTTDSFTVQVKNSKGFLVAKQTSDLTMAVSAPSKLGLITIKRGSEQNGKFTSYSFSVQSLNPFNQDSKLVVSLPPQLSVKTLDGTFVECSGEGIFKLSLECKLSNRRIEIGLALQNQKEVSAGSDITFTLYNVRNPLSLSSSDSFGFELKTSDRLYLISKTEDGVKVLNTIVSQIVIAEVIANNPTLNAPSAYNIDFKPAISLIQGAVIVIQMPKKLRRSTESNSFNCTGQKNFQGTLDCSFNEVTREVTIKTNLKRDQTTPEQTILQINGFLNPSEPKFSESFQIKVYDEKMFLSEQILDGLSFTKSCDYPCLTCGLSKKTCLSCQLDSAFPLLYNSTCLDKCPGGFYGDPQFSCQRCDTKCGTCSNTATNCTSCRDTSAFLHARTGRCVNKCPEGQFTDTESGTCIDCNKNCTTCTGLNTCKSCLDGFFLEKSTCYDVCPQSMLPSPDRKTCIDCKAPCKECFQSVDQCSSCDQTSKLKFLYGYSCLEICPPNYSPAVKDGFTCELITEDVVPFVFLLLSLIASLGIGVAKIFKKNIHYKNTQIGVISAICLGNWIFLTYLTVKDQMWQSSVVLLYGLLSSYILNAIFFCLYLTVMRQDEYYNRWRDGRKCGETVLVIAALLTSFQLYRIAFQQLSQVIKETKGAYGTNKEDPDKEIDKEGGSLDRQVKPEKVKPETRRIYKFQDENGYKVIFNKLTIVMISCVLVPVLIQNIYNLHFTSPGRQLFWEDVESIAITSYLLVLMTFDAYKKTKKLDLAQLKRTEMPVLKVEGNNNSSPIKSQRGSFDSNALAQLFNSTNEMKRFKDVIVAAMNQRDAKKNRVHISGSKEERRDSEDLERDDDMMMTGENLKNTDDSRYIQVNQDSAIASHRPRSKQAGQLEGVRQHLRGNDTTVISINTDELASDRRLINRDSSRINGDTSYRESDPEPLTLFTQGKELDKKYRSPIIEESQVNQTTEDENIYSTKNDNESEDENRENIHGVTDQEILKKLQIQNARLSMGEENYRDSIGQSRDRGLTVKDIRATGTNFNFIAGRSLEDEYEYQGEIMKAPTPRMPTEERQESQRLDFSLGSQDREESQDLREGGQATSARLNTRQIMNSQNTSPHFKAKGVPAIYEESNQDGANQDQNQPSNFFAKTPPNKIKKENRQFISINDGNREEESPEIGLLSDSEQRRESPAFNKQDGVTVTHESPMEFHKDKQPPLVSNMRRGNTLRMDSHQIESEAMMQEILNASAHEGSEVDISSVDRKRDKLGPGIRRETVATEAMMKVMLDDIQSQISSSQQPGTSQDHSSANPAEFEIKVVHIREPGARQSETFIHSKKTTPTSKELLDATKGNRTMKAKAFKDQGENDPSIDDIKMLNNNLKGFGIAQKKHSRAQELREKHTTTKKSDTNFNRTQTSWGDAGLDHKKIANQDQSKDRPVTAMEVGSGERGNQMKNPGVPVQGTNWYDFEKQEKKKSSLMDSSAIQSQMMKQLEVDRDIIRTSKRIKHGEEDKEEDIHFYRLQSDDKSIYSKAYSRQASTHAKSFSPMKRLRKQQEAQEEANRMSLSKMQTQFLDPSNPSSDRSMSMPKQLRETLNKQPTFIESKRTSLASKPNISINPLYEYGNEEIDKQSLRPVTSRGQLEKKEREQQKMKENSNKKIMIPKRTKEALEVSGGSRKKSGSKRKSKQGSYHKHDDDLIDQLLENTIDNKFVDTKQFNQAHRAKERWENDSNCEHGEEKKSPERKSIINFQGERESSNRRRVENDWNRNSITPSAGGPNYKPKMNLNLEASQPRHSRAVTPDIHAVIKLQELDALDKEIQNFENISRLDVNSQIGGHSRIPSYNAGRHSEDNSLHVSNNVQHQPGLQRSDQRSASKDILKKSTTYRAGAFIMQGSASNIDIDSNGRSDISKGFDLTNQNFNNQSNINSRPPKGGATSRGERFQHDASQSQFVSELTNNEVSNRSKSNGFHMRKQI